MCPRYVEELNDFISFISPVIRTERSSILEDHSQSSCGKCYLLPSQILLIIFFALSVRVYFLVFGSSLLCNVCGFAFGIFADTGRRFCFSSFKTWVNSRILLVFPVNARHLCNIWGFFCYGGAVENYPF